MITGVLVIIGLTAFVIPGVLILVFVFIQNRTYERDMKAFVIKWVHAGKPMPGEKIKAVQKLEKIKETKVERITEKTDKEGKQLDEKGFETKLQELNSMKEKGLISEEEFQQLCKKALGALMKRLIIQLKAALNKLEGVNTVDIYAESES